MPETDLRVIINIYLKNTIVQISALLLILCSSHRASCQSTDMDGNFITPDKKFASYSGRIKAYKKFRYLSFGGGFHLLNYFGDLSRADHIFAADLSLTRPGISIFGAYKYSPRTTLQLEFLYGRIMGDDNSAASVEDSVASSLYIRNLSFRNNIFELSLTGKFDLLRNFREYHRRKPFNIYLMTGLSFIYHNPQGKVPDFKIDGSRFSNSGQWVALRPLGTEGQFSEHYQVKPYSRFQLAIPFGGGFAFRLNERLDFSLEFAYRFMLTDYLDDVSGKYVDLGALDGDLAKAMSDRSREEKAILTGERRDLKAIAENTEPYIYPSQFDGQIYKVIKGFGHEGGTRGGKSNDMYFVTSFKISYILGATF
jgi:hypothetical protein